MAHVARVDEYNIVREVHVINNHDLPDDGAFTIEVEQAANEFQTNLGLTPADSRWLLTSYNGNFRKQYAGIGYTYSAVDDVFIAPQPYPSWSLDDDFEWVPPIPRPSEGQWVWDEELEDWSPTPANW